MKKVQKVHKLVFVVNPSTFIDNLNEKVAIENFYNARSGEFESFTFDLSHINESGTINARFDGPLQITQVLSHGTALTDNFFTVNFKLQETYD